MPRSSAQQVWINGYSAVAETTPDFVIDFQNLVDPEYGLVGDPFYPSFWYNGRGNIHSSSMGRKSYYDSGIGHYLEYLKRAVRFPDEAESSARRCDYILT